MMSNKIRIFNLIFFLIAAGELLSYLFSISVLHFICKPLLLACLSVYFYTAVKGHYNKFALLIQLGFFFSWVGDLLLMFEERDQLFFILGLIAFLLTHLLYVFAFGLDKSGFIRQRPYWAVLFVLLGGIMYYLLFPNLDVLAGPVFVYTSMIVLMVIFALNRKNNVSGLSFKLVFFGALIFMVSDSLLAFNKFLTPIPYAGFFIMATYIAAQYLIMKGSIVHLRKSRT